MRRIITRLALLGCIVLVTAGSTSFCSAQFNGSSSDSESLFVVRLVIKDSSGHQRNDFVMGEPIRFDLDVRNVSANRQTLTFGSSQTRDFVVLDSSSSNVRWKWSQGQAFTQATTSETFEPHTSKTYTVTWNAALSDGTQLPVGGYRARGAMLFEGFATNPLIASELGSGLEPFTVR